MQIVSVNRVSIDSVEVCVTIAMPIWVAARDNGGLGQLYGIDLSNAIYHATGVKAYQPTVDDHARAKNGIKIIKLTCLDSEWTPCDNVIRVDFINKKRVA